MGLGDLFGLLGIDQERREVHRRGLVTPDTQDHPSTDEHRVVIDLAYVVSVDYKTKTLNCRTFTTKLSPTNIEWGSLMFDSETGNGVYTTPVARSVGIYVGINNKGIFLMANGVIDQTKGTGYSNGREEVPPGSFVVKTSRETKSSWSPNILSLQAAHFCKIVLQRVSKQISAIFYKLNLKTLGGFFTWDSNPDLGVSRISLGIASLLPGKKDQNGNTTSPASSYLSIKTGTPAHVVRMEVGPTVVGGSVLEEGALTALRSAINYEFGIKDPPVRVREDLLREDCKALFEAFFSFTSPQDLTDALMIEAIVDAASFTDQAQTEGKGGVRRLSPTEDSIERIGQADTSVTPPRKDGDIFVVPADRKPSASPAQVDDTNTLAASQVAIDANFEFFIPANAVENKRVNGAPTIAKKMIEKARKDGDVVVVDPQRDAALSSVRFGAYVFPDGAFSLDHEGTAGWKAAKSIALQAVEGPCDIDAGSGFHVQAREGQLFIGFRTAGITITKDEEIIISGKKITQHVWRPRTPLNARDKARLTELGAKRAAAVTAATQALQKKGLPVPDVVEPDPSMFGGALASEFGQLTDDEKSDPATAVTDNGTKITVAPDSITVVCGESILLQAPEISQVSGGSGAEEGDTGTDPQAQQDAQAQQQAAARPGQERSTVQEVRLTLEAASGMDISTAAPAPADEAGAGTTSS